MNVYSTVRVLTSSFYLLFVYRVDAGEEEEGYCVYCFS